MDVRNYSKKGGYYNIGWEVFERQKWRMMRTDIFNDFPMANVFEKIGVIFFVTGTNENPAMKERLGLNAPNVDLLWARTKSFFSFGHLKVVRAADENDGADKVLENLGNSKTLGSVILESHAHTIDDPDRNPLTTSLQIGDGGRIDAKSNISSNPFFSRLSGKATSNTKVFLGNCWSACTPFQPVLQTISGMWNGASVYGQASDNRTMSLFSNNSFTQNNYIKSKEAAWFQRGGRNSYKKEQKFDPYDEWGGVGKYFKSSNGGAPTRTGIIHFGAGASIR